MTRPAAEAEATLDLPLPEPLRVGTGNAFFIAGTVGVPDRRPKSLHLELDGSRCEAMAFAMPRPDRGADSGFWAIVAVSPRDEGAAAELTAITHTGRGQEVRAPLGTVSLVPGRADGDTDSVTGGRVAICMATHEPPPELFRRQIESIRAQTHRDWECVISDDASSDGARAMIREAIAGDERIRLIENADRLGFFHNFERALRHAPPAAEFVALADQDDYWHPDKLERLLDAIGDAGLVYSDAQIVDEQGAVLSPTYWSERPNQWSDLASLILANTVSGGASLYRRSVVELALPFPPAFGSGFFHDHWLAIVARTTARIEYIDAPLYDYVQHRDAALGHERANVWTRPQRTTAQRARRAAGDPQGYWEDWRLTYFTELCRAALLSRVALVRCAGADDRDRRVLERLAAGDSLGTAAWLAGRRVARRVGRDETLGAEGRLLKALAWRWALRLPQVRPVRSVLPSNAAPLIRR